jgi:hypothetical protein
VAEPVPWPVTAWAAVSQRPTELPVIVGLENKLYVFSNDISYDVAFASTWTLNSIEFAGS